MMATGNFDELNAGELLLQTEVLTGKFACQIFFIDFAFRTLFRWIQSVLIVW